MGGTLATRPEARLGYDSDEPAENPACGYMLPVYCGFPTIFLLTLALAIRLASTTWS